MEANIASNIHTLSINHITEEDYGNYTCHATNRLGDAKEIIVVSGLSISHMSFGAFSGLSVFTSLAIYLKMSILDSIC